MHSHHVPCPGAAAQSPIATVMEAAQAFSVRLDLRGMDGDLARLLAAASLQSERKERWTHGRHCVLISCNSFAAEGERVRR